AGEPPPAPQPAPEAKMEFESHPIVLLVRPANAPDYPPEKLEEIQAAHLAHIGAMAESGKLVAAGPFDEQSDPRYRGILIFRLATAAEARALAEQDPAVKAGRLEVVSVNWYHQRGAVSFPLAEKTERNP
ncbi:MAG: hypothetical protein F9K16_12150, partial [Thermoanaerobaculia bacterium]